jgi:hypothetical protein
MIAWQRERLTDGASIAQRDVLTAAAASQQRKGNHMSTPKGLKVADWGAEVDNISDTAGKPIFKKIDLCWCKPREWRKGEPAPVDKVDTPFLYALIRNHGNSKQRDTIEYIGLTRNAKGRFGNHATAKRIVEMNGSTWSARACSLLAPF